MIKIPCAIFRGGASKVEIEIEEQKGQMALKQCRLCAHAAFIDGRQRIHALSRALHNFESVS